jgi:hypothetical protein
MNELRYKLGLDGRAFDSAMSKALSGVGAVSGALAALGATGVFVGLIRQGFAFNQSMKDSEAAIAQVLAQFKGLDAAAAKAEAAAAIQQIVDLEPKAAGSLQDLTGGFLATLAASQSAGLSVAENIDLVGRFANAMANAAIPTDQLAQEMRSIVTANIGADSSLARILGITNEMVNQARDSGTLYAFLTQKIGKLGEAGDTAAVAFSSLQSALDKAAGALTAGLFDQAVQGSKDLTVVLSENMQAFTDLGVILRDTAAIGIEVFGDLVWVIKETLRLGSMLRLVLGEGMSFADAEASLQALEKAKEFQDRMAKQAAKDRAAAKSPPRPAAAPAGAPAGTPAADSASASDSSSGSGLDRSRRINARPRATRRMGGLDDFNRLQQIDLTGPTEGQYTNRAGLGGTSTIPARRIGGGLDAFNKANNLRGLPGAGFPGTSGTSIDALNRVTNPNATPVGDRVGAALRKEDKAQQKANQADPTLQTLKNIEAELKRIRTA